MKKNILSKSGLKNQKNIFSSTGFTLVETLVAVGILVLAVTGAFTAAQSGISSYLFSKNQIIAFYLAQEAVEEIRNRRDTNAINSNHWLTGVAAVSTDVCYFGKTCALDVYNNALSYCGTGLGSCAVLRQDPTTGFYGYGSGWTSTNFKREIQINPIYPPGCGNTNTCTEVSLLVSISWSKGITQRQFKVRENLYNW